MPTEVEVPRRFLDVVRIVGIGLGLAVLGLVGWANTPIDDHGHPLLLTPQRRAIRRYLDRSARWSEAMDEVARELERLMPEEAEIEGVPPPADRPTDLYRRTQLARRAQVQLEQLARQVERARPPAGLAGLEEVVLEALEAEVAWSQATASRIGAPDAVSAAALAERRAATWAALARLREALVNGQ